MKKTIKIIIGAGILILLAGFHAYQDWDDPIYSTEIESDGYDSLEVLNEGSYLEQEFYCGLDGLKGIKLQPVLFGRTDNGTLSYTLRETESQDIVAEGKIDPANWTDGAYNEIAFSTIGDSSGKTYTLRIEDDHTTADKGISFYATEKGKHSVLHVNDQEIDRTLVMQVVCKTFHIEEFIVFLGMLAYIILFIQLLYKFLR